MKSLYAALELFFCRVLFGIHGSGDSRFLHVGSLLGEGIDFKPTLEKRVVVG